MSFEELIESKHPTAWIEFEEGRVDEVQLQLAGIHKIHLSFISTRRRYQFKSSVLRTRFYRLFRSSLFFFLEFVLSVIDMLWFYLMNLREKSSTQICVYFLKCRIPLVFIHVNLWVKKLWWILSDGVGKKILQRQKIFWFRRSVRTSILKIWIFFFLLIIVFFLLVNCVWFYEIYK